MIFVFNMPHVNKNVQIKLFFVTVNDKRLLPKVQQFSLEGMPSKSVIFSLFLTFGLLLTGYWSLSLKIWPSYSNPFLKQVLDGRFQLGIDRLFESIRVAIFSLFWFYSLHSCRLQHAQLHVCKVCWNQKNADLVQKNGGRKIVPEGNALLIRIEREKVSRP